MAYNSKYTGAEVEALLEKADGISLSEYLTKEAAEEEYQPRLASYMRTSEGIDYFGTVYISNIGSIESVGPVKSVSSVSNIGTSSASMNVTAGTLAVEAVYGFTCNGEAVVTEGSLSAALEGKQDVLTCYSESGEDEAHVKVALSDDTYTDVSVVPVGVSVKVYENGGSLGQFQLYDASFLINDCDAFRYNNSDVLYEAHKSWQDLLERMSAAEDDVAGLKSDVSIQADTLGTLARHPRAVWLGTMASSTDYTGNSTVARSRLYPSVGSVLANDMILNIGTNRNIMQTVTLVDGDTVTYKTVDLASW